MDWFSVLDERYDSYKETAIEQRRYLFSDVEKLFDNYNLTKTVIGKSVRGQSLYSLAKGNGDKRILLWSQMHGNEPTATLALLDVFRFLSAKDDSFTELRQTILQNCSLCFFPIVNPDGTDDYTRRNAVDIDLNRDALRKQAPETKALFGLKDTFKPHFAFNLHDQRTFYNIGDTAIPATISFLAPSYEVSRAINAPREQSMKLIASINKKVQQLIPGGVGKYSDEFYPTATGDNFQKEGISTVLIESGPFPNDPERQYVRKLNFLLIIQSLYEIATDTYLSATIEEYKAIPDNGKQFFDVLIKNILIDGYQVDLGINLNEKPTKELGLEYDAKIEDLGDLSYYFGHTVLDCEAQHTPEKPLKVGDSATFTILKDEKAKYKLTNGVLTEL